MTKRLDQAVQATRELPADRQDEIAQMMMLYAELPIIQLTLEEEAELAAADEEIARGDFASDEMMRAIWATYEK